MACPASGDTPENGFFVLISSQRAVRDALREIFLHPVTSGLPDEARGSAEIVLAEALNNIVEHAYGQDDGKIELRLQATKGMLRCDVFDCGAPMPGCELPKGLPQPIGDLATLPEGGFGWFLIRTLTQNLAYRRNGERNHLSFQLIIQQ